MQLKTKLGSFTVEEDKIISFPRGILGLEDYKKYIILDHPGTEVLKWLQCIDATEIALPVILPELFFPDYRPQFLKEDLLHLEIRSPEEAIVLCVITVPSNPQKATVNLKAPVIINPHRRLADQIIAENEEYKVRQPLNLEKIACQRRCKSC